MKDKATYNINLVTASSRDSFCLQSSGKTEKGPKIQYASYLCEADSVLGLLHKSLVNMLILTLSSIGKDDEVEKYYKEFNLDKISKRKEAISDFKQRSKKKKTTKPNKQ